MAATMTKANPKIKRTRQALTGLIVFYGIGGIGKTTVACQAPAPLVLDCAGGADELDVDVWSIGTAADLKEAVGWLKAGAHGYQTAILDGLDFLYARLARADQGGDLRARHLRAQETLHPILYDFLALPLLKVIVVNERKKADEKTGRRTAQMDLAPRLSELVDNAAHVLARCEMRPGQTESVIRVRRVDTDQAYVQAKCRTAALKDGDKLSEFWAKLARVKPPSGTSPSGVAPESGEVGGPVALIPTNPAEAVRFLNHQLGQDFFRATDHLANVLTKHGDGVPADGDEKGWTHAVAVALDYARGQLDAPPASTQQPALAIAAN